MKNSCIGKCCEGFYMPFSPEGLERIYENYINYKEGKPCIPGAKLVLDAPIMYQMLIHKGVFTREIRYVDKDGNVGAVVIEDTKINIYTCRHFDKEKHECGIYNIRPHFCRSFPDENIGSKCNYKGCSFKHEDPETIEIDIPQILREQRNANRKIPG